MESTPSPARSQTDRFLWALPIAVSLLVFGSTLAPDYGSHVPRDLEGDLAGLEPGDPILQAPWFPPEVTYSPVIRIVEGLARLTGAGPSVLRVLDLLLHVGASLLAYALLRELLPTPLIAALGGCLFAVLSVHSDAVSSGVGRGHLFTTLAVLGSWYIFLRLEQRRPGTLLAFLGGLIVFLGLLVSPVVVLVIPLVLFSSWLLRRAVPWLTLTALASSTVGYLVIRRAAMGDFRFTPSYTENPLAWEELPVRILGAVSLMARYVGKVVAPLHLSADYSYRGLPILEPGSPFLWVTALAFLGIATFTVVHFRKRQPLISLAVLFFVLAIIPFANLLFPARAVFHERYAHLAAFAFPLALGAAAHLAPLVSRQRVVTLALTALVLTYGSRTWVRNCDWGVPMVLRMTEEAPLCVRSHLKEGEAYLALWARAATEEEKSRLRLEVEKRAATCLDLYPEYPLPHFLLGRLLYNEHAYDEAARSFDRALELFRKQKPAIPEPKLYRWRGECNLHLGNSRQALKDLDVYLQIMENVATSPDPITFNVRGLVRAQLSESREYLEELARDVPEAEDPTTTTMSSSVPSALSIDGARIKTLREALRDFNTAIGLNPGVPEFWNNRGYSRFQLGDFGGAIRDYDKGLRIVRKEGVLYSPTGESVHAFLERIAEVYREVAVKEEQAGNTEAVTKARTEYTKVKQAAVRLRAQWEQEQQQP